MSELVVTDLFPLSEAAVGSSFLMVGHDVPLEIRDDLRGMAIEESNKWPGLYVDRLYRRYPRTLNIFSDESGTYKQSEKEKSYVDQYLTGLLIGFSAMSEEASLRRSGGVLPVIPRAVFNTWSHDYFSRFWEDGLQFLEMYRTIKTNNDSSLWSAIHKNNVFGTGRLNFFMRSEPELSRAYTTHLQAVDGRFTHYVHMTRGIFDICSLVWAYRDSVNLNKLYGEDSPTQSL